MLFGRDSEKRAIDQLLASARDGHGGALVFSGVAGSGKTALLDHAAGLGGETLVLRAAGVQMEADLPYAALHMLLRPVFDGIDALPQPQAGALRAAFGLGSGEANRFVVGLATLTLLAERAEARPIVCLVDDAQWLDLPSFHALLFAARRFDADRVAMLFASRVSGAELRAEGLPEREVSGLDHAASVALLEAAGVPARARERLITATDGNPLALRELARDIEALTDAGSVAVPLTTKLQQLFAADVESLDEDVRSLLLIAAAEGSGDTEVILRAADGLGIGAETLRLAAETGHIDVTGDRVTFRHPLVRAAVYQSANPPRRRAVHAVLSRIFDSEDDADRRAWHAAACVTGTDDAVANDLAASAERAAARGGQAAAVTILERAAQLSSLPDVRGGRLVAAAEAAGDSGQHDRTRDLAARAEPLVTDAMQASRLAELRAEEELLHGSVLAARDILDEGARRVAAVNGGRAVIMVTHLANAAIHWGAPQWASDAVELLGTVKFAAGTDGGAAVDGDDGSAASGSEAAGGQRDAAAAETERGDESAGDDGGAAGATGSGAREHDGSVSGEAGAGGVPERGGASAADGGLIAAAAAACEGIREVMDGDAGRGVELVRAMVSPMRPLRSGMVGARVFAATLSDLAADDDVAVELLEPLVDECRASGMVGWLPTLHTGLSEALTRLGRFRDARASVAEGSRIAVELGQTRMAACLDATAAVLAAVGGEEIADEPGDIPPWALATWRHAQSLAALARGNYEVAVGHWNSIEGSAAELTTAAWVWAPGQVEAAVRVGDVEGAARAYELFARWARGSRRGDLNAIRLRCEALLADESEAGQRFEAALAAHEAARAIGGWAPRPFDGARTTLLYGEWLRRHRDRAAARRQLRRAADGFERLGAVAWAERAGLELRATGETRTTRTTRPDLRDRLTPQELQVVKLAATGATNRDIGAQLFLSPRTVGHHLYKAFPKLGVANRAELARVFAEERS